MNRIIESPAIWPEAEVIASPRRTQDAGETEVLVRRRAGDLCGPGGEEIVYCPGYPCISLFSGIGGFEIGMEPVGFVFLCQHEMDRTACQTLIHNRPNFFRHAALIQGDINQTPASMILSAAGLRVGECYIVTGGPPCQGFSTAGRRDPDDVRNTLVFSYLQKVREIQPRFFAFEKVAGFVSMK